MHLEPHETPRCYQDENLLVGAVSYLSRLPQSDFRKQNLMIKKGLSLIECL